MVTFKKLKAIFVYALVYGLTVAGCYTALKHPISLAHIGHLSLPIQLLLVDLVASLFIFFVCVIFNTFSINDLYWTLQATCLSIYYFIEAKQSSYNVKSLLVLGLVNLWSARLSWNLLSTGLSHVTHEDWRFTAYRSQWKPRIVYFLLGFVAFILVPNLIVYVACLPTYYVFNEQQSEMKLLDWVALVVTLLGIWFEAVGDYQLHSEIARKKKSDSSSSLTSGVDKGLWSLCRHPNYFGEITFWQGLFLFAVNSMKARDLDAQLALLLYLFGPFAVFALIYFGSLPLMEERQLKRRTEFYRNYMRRVPYKLLPVNNCISGIVKIWKSLKDEQNPKRRRVNRKNMAKTR